MVEQAEPLESKIKEAEHLLTILLDWIGRYDNRSALLFTLNLAMIGTLALKIRYSAHSFYGLLNSIAFTLLGISIIASSITIFPRLKGPRDSLIYFGSIAKMEKREFKDKFVNRTKTAYLDDLLAQCHINAKILDFKFKVFRISLIVTMVAIIFWSLSLYLL